MAVITSPHCDDPADDFDRSTTAWTEESPNASSGSSEWIRLGLRVAQASGMVAAQADCSPDTALRLMKERAEATGKSLRDIAAEVLERTTSFR